MMEEWKNGMVGKTRKMAVHIIPPFQYSIIPACSKTESGFTDD
jgi:hypothetical protein